LNLNLTQDIKEQAYRLGFSLAGVCTPDPLPHVDVFENWLEQGRHGEMAYLETSRSRLCRAYPQMILPESRSVLVLGIHYPAPAIQAYQALNEMPLHGKIAAYARGIDYHKFLPERLQSLVAFIASQVRHPIPNRWYADTGPLLERELAQRAGLGWIGKNTCLINPGKGSYFLLAEILLGLELEPDQPFTKDRCGSCTRCITACPTGCILPDRTLDSRRCISYLTIELKGSIPYELRPLMGSWVFGCDICQQVCPWNRFAIPGADLVVDSQLAQPSPNLLDEIVLTTDEFVRKYHHRPIVRAKRRGYIRNVAVALGNMRSQEAVPALAQAALDDREPVVRAHAAWALGQIGGESARHALESALYLEKDIPVKMEIQAAMDNL
jgi:epoxyqueuosine reductase